MLFIRPIFSLFGCALIYNGKAKEILMAHWNIANGTVNNNDKHTKSELCGYIVFRDLHALELKLDSWGFFYTKALLYIPPPKGLFRKK